MEVWCHRSFSHLINIHMISTAAMHNWHWWSVVCVPNMKHCPGMLWTPFNGLWWFKQVFSRWQVTWMLAFQYAHYMSLLFSALFRFLHRSCYYKVYIMAYERRSFILFVFLQIYGTWRAGMSNSLNNLDTWTSDSMEANLESCIEHRWLQCLLMSNEI